MPRPLYSPRKEPTVSIQEEAGWAPELVWTLWRINKYVLPTVNRTPAVQSIACRYTDWAIPTPTHKETRLHKPEIFEFN
jgi:hypothetical protein